MLGNKSKIMLSLLISSILMPLALLGDGLIMIMPLPGKWSEPVRLNVMYHRVNIAIDHQVATTKVDQVFENPYKHAIEGTYLFPVPEHANIHTFAVSVDGKELKTSILQRDEARVEYESLVRKHKDPALLEFLGQGMVHARVGKIKAHQKIRINIEYSELLVADNGTVKYHYTLGTEKFSAKELDDVSISMDIKAPQAIANVYSPTHKVAVEIKDPSHVSVRYEEKKVRPLRDFIVYYTMPHDKIGFNVLTYKDDQEDGFFLAMMSPASDTAKKDQSVIAKNIVFVVDRSGSMWGNKMEQAKQALDFCLSRLNAQDHFNVISFDDVVDVYHDGLVEATAGNINDARAYVANLQPRGCTDIDVALKRALEILPEGDAPNMIIFLTDGQPTSGECNIHRIIKNTKKANASRVRLFSFGVGYDVNTTLLDKISLDNKGVSDYIEPEENIEAKVAQFYLKVANPVLTDLVLSFAGTKVSEIYPVELPDLFRGSQLMVVGRYDQGGSVELDLSGKQDVAEKHFVFTSTFAENDTHNSFLPRIWAGRKIAHLVDQVVLEGKVQSLIDEIIALSKRYGIITEYTSFLVDVDVQDFGRGISQDMVNMTSSSLNFASFDQVGSSSVKRAKTQKMQRESFVDMSEETNAQFGVAQKIRNVGARTFYQKGDAWIDAEYSDALPIVKVKLLSDAYFDLLRTNPAVGPYLALGNKVTVVIAGKIFIIEPDDK